MFPQNHEVNAQCHSVGNGPDGKAPLFSIGECQFNYEPCRGLNSESDLSLFQAPFCLSAMMWYNNEAFLRCFSLSLRWPSFWNRESINSFSLWINWPQILCYGLRHLLNIFFPLKVTWFCYVWSFPPQKLHCTFPPWLAFRGRLCTSHCGANDSPARSI